MAGLHVPLLLVLICPVTFAQYSVEVLLAAHGSVRRTVDRCEATGASFGGEVARFSFTSNAIGCGIVPEPEDACGNVTFNPLFNGTSCSNIFAIVKRGGCSFSEKAYNVQMAHPRGFTALIVFNNQSSGPPVDMDGTKDADKVHIPVLMVSYSCKEAIVKKHPASMGYLVQIKISPGYYDLFRYLIPFVVVVGFCFIVLLISLLFKAIRLCRERRKLARKRLSKRNLKKIPTKKFRKGDSPETCSICLDDFVENEKLRVLPCRHTYHCKCIDPWLTQNRKVCPLCKRRVGAKNSDSESSDDERGRPAQPSSSTQTTPLPRAFPQFPSEPSTTTQSIDEEMTPPDSPVATVSNVLVDVHRDHELGGSREQLVDDDFLAAQRDDSDLDEEPEPTLSQSLKKTFKNLFNRSSENPLGDAGRLNTAYQGSSHDVSESAVSGLINNVYEENHPPAPQTETNNQENSTESDRFRDPFEPHNAADGAANA